MRQLKLNTTFMADLEDIFQENENVAAPVSCREPRQAMTERSLSAMA
jgi:hypothetical protein